MFNNIGKKIKTLAKVFCWIGIIGSILGGIGMCFGGSSYYGYDFTMAISGVVFAIVGSLLSWVGSFMLIGFGELIDNSAEILRLLKNQRNEY